VECANHPYSVFSVLCEALANGDEAMAIDIISTDRIYKFGRVHIIET
jgi:hypothetical protein